MTLSFVAALLVPGASPVFAQQSFSFVVSTSDRDDARDAGSAPAASEVNGASVAMFSGRQLEPLAGAQVTHGRLTLVGMEDARVLREDGRQVRQAEWLAQLWSGRGGVTVTAGTGIRREDTGANVLLSRLVVETPGLSGRFISNVVLEKPLDGQRDAIDVITTLAYSRRVAPRIFLGGETLLQDVEGFWNSAEADGGARLFVGPAVDLVPAAGWAVHLTAGEDIRATVSQGIQGDSAAFRAFGGATGFVMRLSAVHRF